MPTLANRINNLCESQTIAMARKSRELIAQGIDIINLSLGEPDFDTPQIIKDAAKKAIDDNFSHYTDVAGYLELRQTISKKFKRDNNLDYTAEQIVVSTGAKQSVANVILALINPGDKVIIPAPYWVSYIELIKLAKGIPIIIKSGIDEDFKITPTQLRSAITSETKMIILSTPCNPTGSVYSKAELKAIAEVIAEFPELYILSDEIYEHINFIDSHQSIAQFDFIKDRVITVNGISKSFAMTGWRVGFMGAPLWIAKACDKLQGQITSNTSSISQKATQAAMEMDPQTIQPMRDEFKKRRDSVLDILGQIPGLKTNIPQGAFYIFPGVSYYFGKSDGKIIINNGTDLCAYLLDTAHVALVPGAAFGDDKYIRLSYATSQGKLTEALTRIKIALAHLK
jgi:aspartate aminotransferase